MKTEETQVPAADAGRGLSEGLGPALEEAAYDCISELAGVDTRDVNLRDHGDAWAAIEAFAAKVQAAERERCAKLCRRVADEQRNSEGSRKAGRMLANWISTGNPNDPGPNGRANPAACGRG